MALITAAVFLIFCAACLLFEFSRRRSCAALPPGPSSLPIFGNILDLLGKSQPQHEIIRDLSRKYGDIMTMWFFTKPVLILSSPAIVKEAYVDTSEISSRPDSFMATLLFDGPNKDIIFGIFSPQYEAKRKIFYQSIRSLLASPVLETETATVVQQVVSKMLQDGAGKSVDLQHYIVMAVYNMVMILAFGKRFNIDDPEFLPFCEAHDLDIEALNACIFFDNFPWLRYLPIFWMSSPLRNMKRRVWMYRQSMMRWYYEIKDRHEETDNMTSSLIKGMDAKAAKKNWANSDEEIMHLLMDLYLGTTATSTAAASWLLLEMVLNPEVQERCYNELIQVVGDRQPVLSDKHHLPYIEACIMETFRHHSPVPLNLPHTPNTDVLLRGYSIPAGTPTILNIWAVHHDPKLWKDPDNFNPENFLDADGRFNRPQQHFLPFGAGRRLCPGGEFGLNRIFLMFTVLLQHVRFERVDGFEYDAKVSDSNGGFFDLPKKYFVGLSSRS